DLSESPTVDFQITGRGKVTTEIHSFLCMYDNFNKLLMLASRHLKWRLLSALQPFISTQYKV
ncbi:MAG: hypothetical protein WB870_05265, partial [Gallionellaceae bacterium]